MPRGLCRGCAGKKKDSFHYRLIPFDRQATLENCVYKGQDTGIIYWWSQGQCDSNNKRRNRVCCNINEKGGGGVADKGAK